MAKLFPLVLIGVAAGVIAIAASTSKATVTPPAAGGLAVGRFYDMRIRYGGATADEARSELVNAGFDVLRLAVDQHSNQATARVHVTTQYPALSSAREFSFIGEPREVASANAPLSPGFIPPGFVER